MNACKLLMEMYSGTAVMKNNVEMSQEIKNCTTSGKISVIKRTPSIGWQWAAGFASYGGVKIQNSANFARIYGVGRGAGISIHGLYTVNCANYGYVTGENVGGIQVGRKTKNSSS